MRPKERFSVHAGWLVDGSGGPVQENVILEIEAGGIRAGSCMKGGKVNIPPAIDYSRCTLLPGLVDSHLHLFMSGTGDPAVRNHQLSAQYTEIKAAIRKHLAAHLAAGVVAVRDGGDRLGHALQYKSEFSDDSPIRIQVAGRAWKRAGRYGRLIGRSPAEGQSLARAIAAADHGIDHLKIVNSGLNSLKVFGKETPPQFDLAEMKAAVETARRKGLDVMAHANGRLPVKICIEAGCRSIEHGFFMGRENLVRLADSQTIWVPTAITMKAYAETLPRNSPEADIARRNLDHQLEQMVLAKQLGVKMALGTDAGSLGVHHGKAVREEMALFTEAGFSLPETVAAATRVGAELLGIGEIGVVEPGREATFLVVEGPPGLLPDSLGRVESVYVKGKRVQIDDFQLSV